MCVNFTDMDKSFFLLLIIPYHKINMWSVDKMFYYFIYLYDTRFHSFN